MGTRGASGSKAGNRDGNIGPTVSGAAKILPCGRCPVRPLAVCAALSPDQLGALAKIVRTLRYAAHETVFHEADEADSLFIITSGVASVSKYLPNGRRQVAGFLYPSDFFGLAVAGCYANSVSAVTDLTVCHFVRTQFEALLYAFPKLEMSVLGQSSHELAEAQEQMLLLGRKSALERLASFLLMISGRVRRNGQSDSPLWLPMNRSDIGDYLGLSTETTSRGFGRLEQIGAIQRLRDARVELLDRGMLQDISEGV